MQFLHSTARSTLTSEAQAADDLQRSTSAETTNAKRPHTRFLCAKEVETLHGGLVLWREEMDATMLVFLHKAVTAGETRSLTKILSNGRYGERGNHYTTTSVMVVPKEVGGGKRREEEGGG